MMIGTAEQAAARGAVLLDRCDPGWEHHVVLNDLNLGSTCNCVLGPGVRRDGLVSPHCGAVGGSGSGAG